MLFWAFILNLNDSNDVNWQYMIVVSLYEENISQFMRKIGQWCLPIIIIVIVPRLAVTFYLLVNLADTYYQCA